MTNIELDGYLDALAAAKGKKRPSSGKTTSKKIVSKRIKKGKK